jgi:hypothetical protein
MRKFMEKIKKNKLKKIKIFFLITIVFISSSYDIEF